VTRRLRSKRGRETCHRPLHPPGKAIAGNRRYVSLNASARHAN
jgi:hypothetical protein